MIDTKKRSYQLVDRRRGKVFVLTQWAEYALYECGAALIDMSEEDMRAEIEAGTFGESAALDDARALIEFARENSDTYDIFDGHAERVIELDNGRYALADGDYMSDWEEESRDIPFLEDYSGANAARVYLPSVLVYARRRSSIGR